MSNYRSGFYDIGSSVASIPCPLHWPRTVFTTFSSHDYYRHVRVCHHRHCYRDITGTILVSLIKEMQLFTVFYYSRHLSDCRNDYDFQCSRHTHYSLFPFNRRHFADRTIANLQFTTVICRFYSFLGYCVEELIVTMQHCKKMP